MPGTIARCESPVPSPSSGVPSGTPRRACVATRGSAAKDSALPAALRFVGPPPTCRVFPHRRGTSGWRARSVRSARTDARPCNATAVQCSRSDSGATSTPLPASARAPSWRRFRGAARSRRSADTIHRGPPWQTVARNGDHGRSGKAGPRVDPPRGRGTGHRERPRARASFR